MLRKLATWVVSTLIGLLLVFSVLSLFGIVLFRTVLTESMVPTINRGDLVVGLSWVKPNSGDIAIYSMHDASGTHRQDVVHRVISISDSGDLTFKGDGNKSQDAFAAKSSDVKGTIVAIIPALGSLFLGLGAGSAVFIFIGVAALAFGLYKLLR